MKFYILFFLLFIIYPASAGVYKYCGKSSSKIVRKNDCKEKNPNFEIKKYSLVSVNEQGIYIEDSKTQLVWSPTFSKDKKCTTPYKRAKKRHYKNSSGYFSFNKLKVHCISKLDNYILLNPNRYLIFKK